MARRVDTSLFFLFYVYGYFICLVLSTEARRERHFPWNWSYIDSCECWEPSPAPLKEHLVFLAAEPSLQHHVLLSSEKSLGSCYVVLPSFLFYIRLLLNVTKSRKALLHPRIVKWRQSRNQPPFLRPQQLCWGSLAHSSTMKIPVAAGMFKIITLMKHTITAPRDSGKPSAKQTPHYRSRVPSPNAPVIHVMASLYWQLEWVNKCLGDHYSTTVAVPETETVGPWGLWPNEWINPWMRS